MKGMEIDKAKTKYVYLKYLMLSEHYVIQDEALLHNTYPALCPN